MEFEKIVKQVEGLRWLTQDQGRVLYDLVMNNDVHHILELGFYHGVSTVYMAAALEAKGENGTITTLDKLDSKKLSPNIETLTKNIGLDKYIHPVYADNDYTWELLKLLETKPRPGFDLVFIDGAHIWKTDALAFILCDKMLNENGLIVFDDLKWTMARNADPKENEWISKYSQEEIEVAHIQKVFDLLVKENPNYSEFREEDGFGFARKVKADTINLPKESIVVKTVVVTKEMFAKMKMKT